MFRHNDCHCADTRWLLRTRPHCGLHAQRLTHFNHLRRGGSVGAVYEHPLAQQRAAVDARGDPFALPPGPPLLLVQGGAASRQLCRGPVFEEELSF